MSIEIRSLQESDGPNLSILYKKVFNVDKTPSFWTWKYFKNPAGDHMMKVAVDTDYNGMIIGQIGCIPMNFIVGKENVLGSQVCDIVILPEYQKGGPFFKLHEQATKENLDRGVQFIFGYSIKRTLKISTRLLKFIDVSPIHNLVKILDPTVFIQKKINVPVVSNLAGSLSKKVMQLSPSNKIKLSEGQEILEIQQFDKRFNDLIDSLKTCNHVMVYKDSTYLNWRYINHPIVNYKIFALNSSEGLMGFIVISIEDKEMRRAYILELIAREEMSWIIDILLNKAISYCTEKDVASISAWSFGQSSSWKCLREKSFFMRETPNNLIVRPHLSRHFEMDIGLVANWSISMGDCDAF